MPWEELILHFLFELSILGRPSGSIRVLLRITGKIHAGDGDLFLFRGTDSLELFYVPQKILVQIDVYLLVVRA